MRYCFLKFTLIKWILDTNMNFVNMEIKEMTKSKRKKISQTTKEKKVKKTIKIQTKAAQYTDCLLELHKLQGTLLTRLKNEV